MADDVSMPEDGGESSGSQMIRFGRRERLTISSARRRELMHFAEELATMIEDRTKSHERCLLRSMVESLIGEKE